MKLPGTRDYHPLWYEQLFILNRGVGSGSCGGERKMPSIDVVVESKASSQSASKIDRRTVTREFLYAFFNRLGRRMRTLTPRKTLAKASQKC